METLQNERDTFLSKRTPLKPCRVCGSIPKRYVNIIGRDGSSWNVYGIGCESCEVSPSVYTRGNKGCYDTRGLTELGIMMLTEQTWDEQQDGEPETPKITKPRCGSCRFHKAGYGLLARVINYIYVCSSCLERKTPGKGNIFDGNSYVSIPESAPTKQARKDNREAIRLAKEALDTHEMGTWWKGAEPGASIPKADANNQRMEDTLLRVTRIENLLHEKRTKVELDFNRKIKEAQKAFDQSMKDRDEDRGERRESISRERRES